MQELEPFGRILIVVGLLIVLVGAVIAFGPRIPFLGQLPGDIRIERDNVKVFIPLGTMLVLSLLLSVLLSLFGRSK